MGRGVPAGIGLEPAVGAIGALQPERSVAARATSKNNTSQGRCPSQERKSNVDLIGKATNEVGLGA